MVSKRSQTKGHIMYEISGTGKPIETESRSMVARSYQEKNTLGSHGIKGMSFTLG